ncbi:MAG: hypothetical protein D6689_14830 [Deltaproteobacteria bacterium]|nr:MAG: hypothetical protein D6689_14830 [Deltaproteobacteria bacterium]
MELAHVLLATNAQTPFRRATTKRRAGCFIAILARDSLLFGMGADRRERITHYVESLYSHLEECLAQYRKERWDSSQHFARKSLEAMAFASLEHHGIPMPKLKGNSKEAKLDLCLHELRRALPFGVDLQAAFNVVQRTGNIGSHQQTPEHSPPQRSAEICITNLFMLVEWFLGAFDLTALGISGSRAEQVVREFRYLVATRARIDLAEVLSDSATTAVDASRSLAVDDESERKTPLPRSFADWYPDVRNDLRTIMPREIAELEDREGWLQPDGRATPALHVVVVGQAAVGKSTLINALVSSGLPLLPSGGAGPHTAAAIVVRHAQHPYVEIRYVGGNRLAELQHALTSGFATPEDLYAARLLLDGTPFSQTTADVLATKMADSTSSNSADSLRLTYDVIAAIRAGNTTLRHEIADAKERFYEDLESHAAGSLAPLTEAIEVGWDSEILTPGLCMIDLPGFGIASDKHDLVSRRELQRARAVLWVVDRSGLTEGTLKELRDIRFFRRLANAADDDLVLSIAVSRLDESAKDARRRRSRETRPAFEDALAAVSADVERMIRSQLRDALGHIDQDEMMRVCERVQVFPVAPIEFRKLSSDDDDVALVKSPEATGIPRLRNHLRSLAARRRGRAATQIDNLLDKVSKPDMRALVHRLKTELRVVTPDPECVNRFETVSV